MTVNRIAIVESQEIVREGLKMILSKEEGLLSYCISDPIALFRQSWISPPDLVIMDKVMPGMNGVEAIQEIKKRWDKTKVLIFSAKNSEQNIVRAFQAGANGYILNNASPDGVGLCRYAHIGRLFLCFTDNFTFGDTGILPNGKKFH